MKRWIFIILAAVILIGATVGIILGVKSCKDKQESVSGTESCTFSYLENEYFIGDPIVLRIETTTKYQVSKITYTVNNGEERNLTVDTRALGNGKYQTDTGTEILPTETLTEGWYTFMFYATEADGTRHSLTKTPWVIHIVAPPA